MAFVWLVECKTCLQRFAVAPRELRADKTTAAAALGREVNRFECPHCHEFHDYSTDDLIPGEGRLHSRA